ncbi:MAG: potassium transporter KtrB [Ruminococcaceae bacterium]|nr:potassium transporter KtrB [Oscillospiraceae bacterium]
MKLIKKRLSSTQMILMVFLMLILAGSLLLYLPISSATGKSVNYVDALFTATTATCVTGLVTLPTVTSWSIFGQAVILVLIQIGGLGVITIASGIMVMLGKRIGIDNRILIQDSFNLNSMSGIIKFIKKVIIGTFIIEGIGALLYMTVFIPEFGIKGIWISVFTSVSAFCNAGIDIISQNSLCDYTFNPIINLTTSLLIILGGIGFVVWWDLVRIIRDKKHRHLRFLTLHSKIALSATAFLIVAGTVLFFVFEYNNPMTMQNFSLTEKIEASLFQSVTTRTAGFATIPQENFTDSSAIVSLLLMFIGGSPVGTAGGIKTVTFVVLLVTAVSVIRNKGTVDIFNRRLSDKSIKKAMAVFVTSFVVMMTSTILLSVVSGGDFLDIIYETVSATATVGLTRNFTSTLDTAGKFIIIATMYFGRVGPISLAVAFNVRKSSKNIISNPVEEISVG